MTGIRRAAVEVMVRGGEGYPWHRYAPPYGEAACGLPMDPLSRDEEHDVSIDPGVSGARCADCFPAR